VEWKCDALKAPSQHAAQRLGFLYKKMFKKRRFIKNAIEVQFGMQPPVRNGLLKNAYAVWHAPNNFDLSEGEIKKLSALIKQYW
jgi:hypothetical protein